VQKQINGSLAAINSGVPEKVVIRDPITRLFFAGLGTWTSNREKALIFSSQEEARRVVETHPLCNVEFLILSP
jgi:hypothetical protein